MPGPGSRKSKGKNKNKSSAAEGSSSSLAEDNIKTSHVYSTEIDDAERWTAIVRLLCDHFRLPDITKRSGLKKVHANFDTIYHRLDRAYEEAGDQWKVKGGIVGIVAKMCVDSLLRDKIFAKGFFNKVVSLLDDQRTCHIALRALSTITHHGGVSARTEICKNAHHLTRLMRANPEDETIAELCVIILGHSICVVTEGGERPTRPDLLRTVDMHDIVQTVVEVIKRPHTINPRHMVEHALELLAGATLHAAAAFKAYPSAIRFLVAGLRCKDWPTRCNCLGAILYLDRLKAEEDTRIFDPRRLMYAVQRGVPRHLNDILMAYGPTRNEMYLTMSCAKDFTNAMMTCAQDHNLYSLGLKLSALILKTEFSISDGGFMVEDASGRQEIADIGLPFRTYSESLPHAANAIRAKAKPEEQDLADILDIKYFIMKQRIPDALQHARKGLERNPQQAYFQYAITLGADHVNGLRAAKKGLRCRQITPFLKYQMTQRAVDHAGDMGLKLLQEIPEVGEKQWEEGIAFIMSALEDAKVYLEEAPPDNRHMKNVSYWYVLLSVLTREELSPDLKELEQSLKKLEIADGFSNFISAKPPDTYLRRAQQVVVKYYKESIEEFGHIWACVDDKVKDYPAPVAAVKDTKAIKDDLEDWLEDMYREDGRKELGVRCDASETIRRVNWESVKLYRCSYCGNPSAALRKCSGCAKTRYCDSGCQKQHWSSHKKECMKASAQT